MAVSIKICGLSTPETVRLAAQLGAEYTGFIFFPKSPRHIEPAGGAELAQIARDEGAKPVAVTVDMDDAGLDEIVSALRPALLQLHGQESPERVQTVKTRYGLPVMKAFALRVAADLARIEPYRGVADRFLFDAKPPVGSDLPGGNGVSFDWRILATLDERTDYMLSGGLDAGNVTEALAISRARAVDISSGVESAPGIKDPARMKKFVHAVRTAQ